MMNVDDVVKLMLAFSASASLLGISIQIMRLLGTFNDVILDFRGVGKHVATLVTNVVSDYGRFRQTMKQLLKPLEKMSDLLTSVGNLAQVANKYMRRD